MPEYFGKYRGKVVNNVDPRQLGRLQVSVPAVLGDSTMSWAYPCVPYAGPKVGLYAMPLARLVMDNSGNIALSTATGTVELVPQGLHITFGTATIELAATGISIKNGAMNIQLSGNNVSINNGALEVT